MFFLSWRQLMARKKQTILILLGISFGTLLYVSISGVQLGMRSYMSEQLLNNTAHILISGAERKISEREVTESLYPDKNVRWISEPYGLRENVRLENYSGWYDLLRKDPRVVDFAPRLPARLVLSRGKFNSAVTFVGTLPDRQVRISSIQKYMLEGSFLALEGPRKIIIGSGTADDLGLKVGQYVNVSSGVGLPQAFRVVGIFHFGNKQVDRSLAFGHLTDAQVLTRSPGRVTEIAVALFDIDISKAVADEWRIISRDKVEDWQETNKSFMEMIRVQDFTRYFITTAILLVASFGIYNVLSIMINQKKREIAILRAIGYGPNKIKQLILYQGLVLGLSGGVLGILMGYLLCLYFGSVNLDIDIGGSHSLRISYDPFIYISAFFAAMISSFIASYVPARAASKMSPMDIIRSE